MKWDKSFHLSKNPIFVVGVPRSGTQLLRDILRAHPDIAGIDDESHFFTHFYEEFGQLERDDHWGKLIGAFLETPYFTKANLLRPELLQKLDQCDRSYKDFFSTYMGLVAEKDKAKRWLEKTPGHISHIEQIIELYPNAKFLHIVRDPRDVITSKLRRMKLKSGVMKARFNQIVFNSLTWQKNIQTGWKQAENLGPGGFKEIKFEALLTNEELILEQISHYLNLDPPLVADMIERASGKMQGALSSSRSSYTLEGEFRHWKQHIPQKGITKKPIGRYQKKLSPEEIATIELLIGKTMQKHGYQLTGNQLPLSAKMKILRYFKYRKRAAYWYIKSILTNLGN